jgi:DNA-binding NarL/FixJ family response regulator
MTIRILVADDHPIVRDGLVAVLSTQPDFEVVGEASTGPETIQRVAALQPDVLLLDIEMPELDGVETLKRLREHDPAVRAIMFTAFDTDERIVQAVQAGAQGYLLKGVPRDEIFSAVRVVHAGGALLQPVVASKLLRRTRLDQEPLTAREREVLHLLARGLTNKQIAAELVVTERTVKFHVSAILAKLGAGNRTEAIHRALQQGLVEP